jgi:cytosine/adenosine deaminase-related metal-dependent hydrolase
MRTVALAPCSPFSVSEELLRQTALLARAKGVRLHTHLCETKDEERYTLERFGLRPLDYMERVGWLGPDVWYAHGIHFNDEEIDRLAASGTGVAHCPVSNMKLSSGAARLPDLLAAGVPVGLAVDGSASQDGSDLLEELRICYLLHRLQWKDRAPTGYEILKLATRGSARVLGREDIGSLSVGKCADLFLIDTRRVELAGACEDPKNLLATVGFRQSVDYTMVNGRFTVREGRLADMDEAVLAEQADRVCAAYLRRAGV